MKVTVRMGLVGMATTVILIQAAGAAHSRAVRHTVFSDILRTQDRPVARSLVIGSDESAAFIETCGRTHRTVSRCVRLLLEATRFAGMPTRAFGR
jgi:hypothetical protein